MWWFLVGQSPPEFENPVFLGLDKTRTCKHSYTVTVLQSSRCPVRLSVGEEGSACTTVGNPALVELGTHRYVLGRQLQDTE